jgi:DNA primase
MTAFPIGYSDGRLPSRLPPEESVEGKEIREALTRAGILNDRGREHFSGCVLFAIRDEDGVIRQIYGRRIHGRGAKHLYLPGPHDTLFNPVALRQDSLILTEGLFDALSFWVQGVRNVSFAYGTNGLTPPLLDALANSRVKRVYLAYDADAAGDAAGLKVAESLAKIGITASRVTLPEGSDPNALHAKGESLAPYLEGAEETETAGEG